MSNTTSNTSLKPSDVVHQLFQAAARRYTDDYYSFFTKDALWKAGNFPPAYGPEEIKKAVTPLAQLAAVEHVVEAMWEFGDTVICQGRVLYTRDDGKAVPPIPTCNIIKVKGDKISELLAYGDFSPLFQ